MEIAGWRKYDGYKMEILVLLRAISVISQVCWWTQLFRNWFPWVHVELKLSEMYRFFWNNFEECKSRCLFSKLPARHDCLIARFVWLENTHWDIFFYKRLHLLSFTLFIRRQPHTYELFKRVQRCNLKQSALLTFRAVSFFYISDKQKYEQRKLLDIHVYVSKICYWRM